MPNDGFGFNFINDSDAIVGQKKRYFRGTWIRILWAGCYFAGEAG
jgi:hypothetical protein